MVPSGTVYNIGKETRSESPSRKQFKGEAADNVHAIYKRDAKWKAFGFDSSMLQIADLWGSKNMWFQQLTHSVRWATHNSCPCLVKVPAPNTWPSILETIPEPLSPLCQEYALSWLLYNQQAPTDRWLAMSVHLFRPKQKCKWLSDLPYINLLDQEEEVAMVRPDPMEVLAVRAKARFCSNDTHGTAGMFVTVI